MKMNDEIKNLNGTITTKQEVVIKMIMSSFDNLGHLKRLRQILDDGVGLYMDNPGVDGILLDSMNSISKLLKILNEKEVQVFIDAHPEYTKQVAYYKNRKINE